jgi:dihydrolipoamide dehydrogenase
MSGTSEVADVAILGGGPAGYVAALVAAQRGARVILVEKQRVGGTCLNIGCIPTKVLTTAADLLVHCRRASDFGLSVPHASASLAALMAYKQSTVDQLVGGVEHLLRARRVAVIHGEARLPVPESFRYWTGIQPLKYRLSTSFSHRDL